KLAILIIIVTLLAVGCSDSSGVAPLEQSKQTDKVITDENVTSDVQTEESKTEEEKPEIMIGRPAPYVIKNLKDGKSGSKILSAIQSKTSSNKVSEISQFYNIDNFKIEGHELSRVMINEAAIEFDFTPIGAPEARNNSNLDFILVLIDRHDYSELHYNSDPFKFTLENWASDSSVRLTDDGVIFFDGISSKSVKARLGDTTVSVDLSYSKSHTAERGKEYEYLRDLAFDVIKNAELVTVKD
ncbi:MAG: hypothetical protein FWG83_00545, partial [Oscillospiraceae bacterium]|nr:hypothetical protein [Oscillospiraceae bacterium]